MEQKELSLDAGSVNILYIIGKIFNSFAPQFLQLQKRTDGGMCFIAFVGLNKSEYEEHLEQ